MNPVISAGLLILVSVYIFYGYTLPKYDEINIKREQIIQIEDLLIRANKLNEKRNELVSTYDDITPEIKREVSRSVPVYSTEETAHLLLDIETFAENSNIDLQSLSYKVGSVSAEDRYILLSFSIVDDYFSVKSFLHDLSVWFRGAILENVSFVPARDSNEITTNFELKVFFTKN